MAKLIHEVKFSNGLTDEMRQEGWEILKNRTEKKSGTTMNTIEKELLEAIQSSKGLSVHGQQDKYATEQCLSIVEKYAVGFASFIVNHELDFQSTNDGNWIGLDLEIYTCAELFQLYIQSLK